MKIDFIQGDKFVGLAKYTYAPASRHDEDYNHLPNTLNIGELKDGDIIYTHTMYAKQLFELLRHLDVKTVVITHNSDETVDFPPPDNVIMWYTPNVAINHPRIQSVPLGLENDRYCPNIHKKEKIITKLKQSRNYRNLVYMNFNINTNPTQRRHIYNTLKNKPWVTVDMRKNGDDYDNYIDNIYNHKFVICPEGNGIDTYRIWECLYLGTIPIILDNINNSFYWDYLPVSVIRSPRQITKQFLNNDDVISTLDCWNMEMLKFSYWENKILNHA